MAATIRRVSRKPFAKLLRGLGEVDFEGIDLGSDDPDPTKTASFALQLRNCLMPSSASLRS